jgi:Tfp pilus assembly protein FimT
MVTIGIIAIIAGISIPAFMGWLPGYRLRSAVMDLEGNIQWTRLQAIKSNQTWAVAFNPANSIYYILSDSGVNGIWDGPGMSADSDTIVKTVNLADYNAGVTIAALATTPPAPPSTGFVFTNRGISTTNGNVILANGSGSSRINVSFSGGIASTRL